MLGLGGHGSLVLGGPWKGRPDGDDREGAFPGSEVPEVRLCGWKGGDKRDRGGVRSERWGRTGALMERGLLRCMRWEVSWGFKQP